MDETQPKIDATPNFSINQQFLNTYRYHISVKNKILEFFPKIPSKLTPFIFDKIFTSQPIVFTDYLEKGHYAYSSLKRKIDENYNLIPQHYLLLKKELTLLLNEIAKGFQVIKDDKKEEIITIGDKKCFIINKNHTKEELFKLFCDEEGKVCFKYDFNKKDLNFTTPQTNNQLQLVKIQVTSIPITFGIVIEHKFTCPDKFADRVEDICDSSEVISKKAYELEGVRDKIDCNGHKYSVDTEGRTKVRRCGKTLYPIERMSRFVDVYYSDINFEDNDGIVQGSSAFSFVKLMPGYYEAVIYSYTGHLKTTNYQIVDIKPVEDVNFTLPQKEQNKNYVITLQEHLDTFIQQQCNVKIYGLIPIKIALILQKLASSLDYPLKFNIDFTGEKSTGKSMLFKYYGVTLYSYGFLSTNGLSVSIPALRGTSDKAYVMNKEMNINRIGYLGTYKKIHIDEVGENPDLIQHLKIFLMEPNYSNNMARADGAMRKRLSHINLTKNLNHEHLGHYRGAIKKSYDNLGQKEGQPPPVWNSNEDLFQPIEYYQDEQLKYCIQKQRDKLKNEQKWWIDGCDLALHDRFPFYFYVEDDNNKNLQETLKENATRKKIEEITQMIEKLKNKAIDDFFKNLKQYDVELDKDYFTQVDKILINYNIFVDGRIREIYYMILKLSTILNQRTVPEKEDFDLLIYIIENIDRKTTTTSMEKYEIKGYIKDVTKQQIVTQNFGVKTDDEDIENDFK